MTVNRLYALSTLIKLVKKGLKMCKELTTLIAHHAALKANPSLRRHRFDLQYAWLAVKRERKRLARLEIREKELCRPQHSKRYDSLRLTVVTNKAIRRFQIIFDEKPDEATLVRLKKLNFKWSPKAGAWQNWMTDSGKRKILKFLEIQSQKP